jgi:hypothetical protein
MTSLVGKTMETGVALKRLSDITGDSVADLAKLKKAVEARGGSFEEMSTSLIKLSKNMAAAAGDNGYAEAMKAQAKRAVESVKDGEREQTQMIKDQVADKKNILRDETNDILKEINHRYKLMEQALGDKQSDEEDKLSRQNERILDAQTKSIERQFDARRKAIEKDKTLNEEDKQNSLTSLKDKEDEKLRALREKFSDQEKAQRRSIRDRYEVAKQGIDEQKSYEEQKVKDSSDTQNRIIEEGAADQLKTIQEKAKEAQDALTLDPTGAKEANTELGLSATQAANKFGQLGVQVRDANGKMYTAGKLIMMKGGLGDGLKGLGNDADRVKLSMDLMGRTSIHVAEAAKGGGQAISDMTTSWNDKIAQQCIDLEENIRGLKNQVNLAGLEITKELLPALNNFSYALLNLIRQFKELPDWVKTVLEYAALLGIALTALSGPIGLVLSVLKGLAALQLGATLAGWAEAIGATGIGATVASWGTAILGFLATVAASPAALAIAAVALAVVIFAFRDQIADAFRGLWSFIADPKVGIIALIGLAWNTLMNDIKTYVANILPNIQANWAAFAATFTDPKTGLFAQIGNMWNFVIDGIKSYALAVVQPITDAFSGIVNSLRGTINGLLSWGANGINRFIDSVNGAIARINSISSKIGISVDPIRYVDVPQLAEGGRVDRPTLAMIGEGGQPEYVVPQSKVPQFVGAHMGDAGLGLQGGARGGQAAPVVNISTGPVMQQPDGSHWVSMADAQAMVGYAADQIWRGLTSYDGRRALGLVR